MFLRLLCNYQRASFTEGAASLSGEQMSYRPWKGFTLVGAAILAEFLIPGAMHRTGLLFVISLFVTLGWAEGYVPEGWETK